MVQAATGDATVPRASTQTLWNLCRHAVASVYVFYFQLGGGGSDGGRVITEDEWSVLFRSSLISQSERKVLDTMTSLSPVRVVKRAGSGKGSGKGVSEDKAGNGGKKETPEGILASRCDQKQDTAPDARCQRGESIEHAHEHTSSRG